MAQKVTTVDDFDGTSPAETVKFHVNGTEYSIDLSKENQTELEAILSEFEDKMDRYLKVARSSRRTPSAADTKAVREWALDNGMDVKPKGRISKEIIDAYEARDRRKK